MRTSCERNSQNPPPSTHLRTATTAQRKAGDTVADLGWLGFPGNLARQTNNPCRSIASRVDTSWRHKSLVLQADAGRTSTGVGRGCWHQVHALVRRDPKVDVSSLHTVRLEHEHRAVVAE